MSTADTYVTCFDLVEVSCDEEIDGLHHVRLYLGGQQMFKCRTGTMQLLDELAAVVVVAELDHDQGHRTRRVRLFFL
jgi:hypothetical protein